MPQTIQAVKDINGLWDTAIKDKDQEFIDGMNWCNDQSNKMSVDFYDYIAALFNAEKNKVSLVENLRKLPKR